MGAELEYGEIESVLEQIVGKNVGFEQLVNEAISGGKLFSITSWTEILGNVISEQFQAHGQMIGYLVILIISAAMLFNITKAFKNRQISDMGFYMIYLLLFLIMMKSFGVC